MADDRARTVCVTCYAGHRYYDGASRRYVSVDELRRWAAQGLAVSVIEARTGIDITRRVLA